ncbi:hypothetical protein JXA63_00565 [Candidatus Woesebacteria bacterium]|nr:hypothetical protein [Candidatus Woesebacteria bacterium]
MSGIQTLLVVVIVILTLLLLIVGAQVVLIIVDLRKALKRLNSLLEDSIWGGGLIRPEKLTGILEFFKKKSKGTMEKRGEGEI